MEGQLEDPLAEENDAGWSQWFAALKNDQKAKVIEAVTEYDSVFSLEPEYTESQNSNITHLERPNCLVSFH